MRRVGRERNYMAFTCSRSAEEEYLEISLEEAIFEMIVLLCSTRFLEKFVICREMQSDALLRVALLMRPAVYHKI